MVNVLGGAVDKRSTRTIMKSLSDAHLDVHQDVQFMMVSVLGLSITKNKDQRNRQVSRGFFRQKVSEGNCLPEKLFARDLLFHPPNQHTGESSHKMTASRHLHTCF